MDTHTPCFWPANAAATAEFFISRDPIFQGLRDDVSVFLLRAIKEAIDLKAPPYFLAKDLLAALLATKLDLESTTVDEIKWPLPAMTFFLPSGALQSPSDGEVALIGFARVGQSVDGLCGMPLNLHVRWLPPSTVFYAYTRNGSSFACLLRDERPLGVSDAAAFLTGSLFVPDQAGMLTSLVDGSVSDPKKDAQFLDMIRNLVVKTVVAIDSRPDLTANGGIRKAAHRKRGIFVDEVWEANFVGRGYRIKSGPGVDESDGRAHNRAHIRLGHTRQQACGPGFSMHKAIWIEPTWVGGGGDAPAQ